MPSQVRGVLVHAMSGTELSRVRTEFRLHLPEPINKSPLESRGADIVMQSLTQVEGELRKESLQFCVLCLDLLEDGDVGVGVFPQREKILISGL
jgi:hypothetical protein